MANVNTSELCRILGGEGNAPLSPMRVTQLVKEGMPKVDRGQFDAIRCMYWYLGRMRKTTKEHVTKNSDGTFSGIETERKRLLRAQADLAELEYGRELAGLIPIGLVESEWKGICQKRYGSVRASGRDSAGKA
jgi:phage terminase Nu1 subunit (DNA packaging protein)